MDDQETKQKIKDLSKRLKIVEQIRHSENDPSWMVMDVTPVIPPDLRPLVLLESARIARRVQAPCATQLVSDGNSRNCGLALRYCNHPNIADEDCGTGNKGLCMNR